MSALATMKFHLSKQLLWFTLRAMKSLTFLAIVFALNSCNTTIGLWRDAKHGYQWTKQKMEGSGGGGGGEYDSYDAPVY
jgi:predicted small secreted protein